MKETMNTPTDTQLRQALAKMLPDAQAIDEVEGLTFTRLEPNGDLLTSTVLDTELLHLCWMVEETLNPSVESEIVSDDPNIWRDYVKSLDALCCENGGQTCMHATWQQRTIALAKTRGGEIV